MNLEIIWDRYGVEIKVLHNNYQSCNLIGPYIPLFGNSPKKLDFVHQTFSHWEAQRAGAGHKTKTTLISNLQPSQPLSSLPQVWDGSVVIVHSSTTPWCQDANHVTFPRSIAGRELSSHELLTFWLCNSLCSLCTFYEVVVILQSASLGCKTAHQHATISWAAQKIQLALRIGLGTIKPIHV